MLEGSENKIRRNCWAERTDLEKGLMAVLVLTTILVSILGIVLLLSTRVSSIDGCEKPFKEGSSSSVNNSESSSEPCKTPSCVESASEILNRIDTNINPCEDFYGFVCSNSLPNNRLDFAQPLSKMIKRERSRIEGLYMEPIKTEDHPLVKVQKIMYAACMNETAIGEEAFTTLKEVLKMVGGWPVLEPEWNSDKFDWVQTTYKLRQLGYRYNSFLELKIVSDPDKVDKYIFEISIPTVNHIYSKWFDSDDNSGFMTDVAIALDAEIHRALREMTEVYQFLNDLQWQRNSIMDEKVPFQRATVAEFQQKESGMNWMKFINTIAGPNVTVSRNDVVLFPPERSLDEWFGILNRTPKRTLANYMLWRVVEDVLPYLIDQLVHGRVKPRLMTNAECETRSEFCINEINKRFSPSPINIMYLRTYLSKEKQNAVEELADNMKWGLLEVVKELKWMDAVDKKKVVKEIEDLSIVVGARGNHFDEKIFDTEFNIDISTNNFLKLLSQANRNNHDRLFSLIDKSPEETEIVWADIAGRQWYPQTNENNQITIFASMIQNPIFSEEQPNYLNYANMGILSQYFLYSIFEKIESEKVRVIIDTNADCLIELTGNTSITEFANIDGLISHNLALKVSQKAYQKWAKNKEEEPALIAVDYTPEQLFWIGSGYLFCPDTVQIGKENFDSMLAKVVNTNPDLARDFECPDIPEEICKLF